MDRNEALLTEKIMLQSLFLSNQMSNQRGFLQQLMGAPISQPKL